jgi:hypothetical protein
MTQGIGKLDQRGVGTSSGPIGRRLRWHELFSKFISLTGLHPWKRKPGGRCAQSVGTPGSSSITGNFQKKNGTQEEKQQMQEIMQQEKL